MGFGKAQRRSSVCSLHSPLPSLCLSPDLESTSLLPTGPQSEITHPSAGGIRQERGEGGLDEVWRKTQFQFSVIQTNFQIHSITSCCWFLLWWFWQVYKMRFGSFRPSVFAHDPTTKWVTDSSNPGIQLPNCLFFSASAIVTKALLRKGHPELCVLVIFMVITIVIIFLVLLLFFVCFVFLVQMNI